MLRIVLIILAVSLFSGCSHCSVTRTNFDGKTTGINPYGSGNVKVIREAYWGNLKCILKLINEEVVE